MIDKIKIDSLQLDNGGGLICNNIVFGILSWGVECGHPEPDFPAVYTDVAAYNFWIDSVIDWNDGDHEMVPTPTTTTTPIPTTTTTTTTTTPSPGGATAIVNSIYLFIVCITVGLFK